MFPKALGEERVPQAPALVEHIVSVRHRDFTFDDACSGDPEDAPEILLRPDRTERPRGGTCDRDRLVPERAAAVTGRGPVDGVLQHSRDRAVVLGSDDEQRIRALDLRAEVLYRRGRLASGLVHVLVIRRDELEPVEKLDLDT